jgi:chromosome partitioning protein
MRTVAIVSLKGGAGKTTTTLVLAAMQPDPAKTVILDLDPQASSAAVRRAAGDEGAAVVACTAAQLAPIAARAAEMGAKLCLIDTPPSAGAAMASAIAAADAVIVVSRASALDLARLPEALAAIRAAGRPHAVVLNACPPASQETDEAAAYVAAQGAPLASARLGQRIAFQRLALGRPLDGLALDEARALAAYVATL